MKSGGMAVTAIAAFALSAMVGCVETATANAPLPPEGACDPNPELPIPQGGLRPSAYVNGTPNGMANGVPNGRPDSNGYSQGQALDGILVGRTRLDRAPTAEVVLNALRRDAPLDAAPTELVGTLADGAPVRGEAFVGATITGVLRDGSEVTMRIAGFTRTPDPDVVTYRLENAEGRNVCGEGGEGMFLRGSWDAAGAYHERRIIRGQVITSSFACTTGAIAKCIRWGYAPWRVGEDLHQACTRMTRADYCGDGVSHTKNGTLIDIRDVKNIHAEPTEGEEFLFEAGWGPNGAVCVQRPRFDALLADGTSVLPSCWSSLPSCDSHAMAKAKGAFITNTSRVQSRLLCGP